jgi:hypothetical protein
MFGSAFGGTKIDYKYKIDFYMVGCLSIIDFPFRIVNGCVGYISLLSY